MNKNICVQLYDRKQLADVSTIDALVILGVKVKLGVKTYLQLHTQGDARCMSKHAVTYRSLKLSVQL